MYVLQQGFTHEKNQISSPKMVVMKRDLHIYIYLYVYMYIGAQTGMYDATIETGISATNPFPGSC